MPEKKRNTVPLSGQIRLPEDLDRQIDMEASRLGCFKYDVVAAAWRVYTRKEGRPDSVTGDIAPVSDWHDHIPSGLRAWIDIIERAETVRDVMWRSMLASIKGQLTLVAKQAGSESKNPCS
jgi:hypothetical protein